MYSNHPIYRNFPNNSNNSKTYTLLSKIITRPVSKRYQISTLSRINFKNPHRKSNISKNNNNIPITIPKTKMTTLPPKPKK